MDMGIDSYLIADSVVGIIAQRLVRRLCPHCKKPKLADAHELEYLGVSPDEKLTIYEPAGCVRCNKTGYFGRIGVYEIMEITPKIKTMISKKATADEIKAVAVEEGMSTLRQSAGKLVRQGVTSFKEMLPVSFDE
jgi:type IV pilus assembly protein PilB